MANEDEQDDEIIDALASDPFFRDLLDPQRMFSRNDIDEAIATVLGTRSSSLPPLPGATERAMARLAIFQIVADHLRDCPVSWLDLLRDLTSDEREQVEAILGRMSLGELFE